MTVTDLSSALAETAAGREPRSLAISARVTLSVHALNNEGSRNNATIPRQVNVATADEVVQANAISGDTLKHAFADYLRAYATDAASDNLPLCAGCRLADANRANIDPEFTAVCRREPSNLDGNRVVLAELGRRCVICDVAGLLVTLGNRNAPRPSRVHFGWQVGIPERVRTGQYTHVKFVPGAGGDEALPSQEGSNLGQIPFTRPASSGVYALVVRADLGRIGLHDMTGTSVIEDAARRSRVLATTVALYQTIAAPDGAQVNTQLPHLHGAQGAIAVSFSSLPAALVSALQPDFVEQMGQIASAFMTDRPDQIVVPFSTIGELGQALAAVGRLTT